MSLNKNKLSIAIAIAAGLTASTSFAQDQQASEIEVEEVMVTGFRQSLQNSMNAKRENTGSVDAIFAEDIADFPDANLAESMQRIPGVAISRVGGEGRQISVRGLGPQFTRVRVNGMEASASTGGTDAAGGANRTRSFDFNTLSSDLFNSLVVKKTGAADTEEGSLGATVELRTLKPSDFSDFTVKVSGQAGYNDLSEEVAPKLTFVIANQFTDSFGAVFGISHENRKISDEGVSTVRWSNSEKFKNVGSTSNCMAAVAGDDGTEFVPGENAGEAECIAANGGAFHPRIPRYDSYSHEKTRTSAVLGLELAPIDGLTFNLDLVNSVYDANRREVFMQGVGNSASSFVGSTDGTGGYTLTDYTIEGSTIVSGYIEGGNVQSEDRYDELETTFTQAVFTTDWEISDRLRANAVIGTSSSKFDNPIQNTVIMRANGVGYGYDFSGGGESASLTFGDAAYQNDSWTLTGIRQRPMTVDNDFTNVAVDMEFDINDSLTLKGGINSKNYEYSTWHRRLGNEGSNGVSIDNYIISYDSGLGDGRAWLIPNREAIANDYGVLTNSGDFVLSEERQGDNYGIKEDTVSLWAQLDFNYELGEVPVSGNIGFRQFSTDQSSTGWFDTNGDGIKEQIWVDHSYDDLLPSLNLKFEPTEEIVLRFSVSEGIARAGLGSLKADQSLSVSGSSQSISGGNPKLEPTRATSFDAGLELYLSEDTALAFNLFKKDIKSHVQTVRTEETPASLGIPKSVVEAQCNASQGYGADCNENTLWDTSTPINGPGGDLHGFELQIQGNFGVFGSLGEYFGYIAGYTFVESEMDYLDENGNIVRTADLLGLSAVTSSGTLYFENDRFSARISTVHRSDYLTDAVGRNSNIMGGTYGTNNVDFSSSFNVTDDFKITFEALNLTNEADDQWVDISDQRVSYYHETGTTFTLGAAYAF